MADGRRFEIDELLVRPGTYFNPLTEPHWPVVLDLVKRNDVRPELWTMLNNALVDSLPAEVRPQRAAEILGPAAQAAAERGCKIGLYNHGG